MNMLKLIKFSFFSETFILIFKPQAFAQLHVLPNFFTTDYRIYSMERD